MAGADNTALLLTVSADTSKALKAIDNLNKKLSGAAPEMQRSAKKAVEGIENEFSKINVGKALDRIFDRSRLAVIEEGGAKIGVFGSAIEELGPAGLVAAAGVAALGVALEEAHKAVEFADSLYKAAAAAHVSTDALQEMRVAVTKAGGDASAAGPALLAFSETLGKAQEGLNGIRPFQALFGKGFSVADVKGLGGNEQALDAVVAKIQNLSSRSQQDAAIDQFGLKGLAPLILSGADAWTKYREEAKAAGLVLDGSVIKRGHDLNVQMDELSGKIKNELTQAFIDLGPILVDLLKLLEKAAHFAKDVADGIGNHKTIQQQIDNKQAYVDSQTDKNGHTLGLASQKDIDAAKGEVAQLKVQKKAEDDEAERKRKEQEAKDKADHNGHLYDLTKKPKAADQTAELDKAALDALNTGLHAQAAAQAALITGIYAHAEAEKDAVDKGLTKKLDDLELEAQKIAKSKNDADKLAQRAKINSAKVAERQAAEAQKQLIDQQATTKALEEWLAYADRIRANYSKIASNAAHMAVTADERNAIETKDLLANQRRELDNLDLQQANSLKGKSGTDLDDQISKNKADRGAVVDRQASDRQVQAYDQAGPLDKYLRSIQDLNTEFQTDGVQAIQSLSSGLIDAALHAKNLGDVLKTTFLNLLQQILTQTLEKEAAPGLANGFATLLHFIPGFASGTSSAPGGLALVGEKGPELVNLPKGAGVTPSFQTLDAINSMRAPKAGGVTVIQPLYLDASGAVMTQEFAAELNAKAAAYAAQAGHQARAAAVADVKRAGYLGQANQ
jgi:hypothetical protein